MHFQVCLKVTNIVEKKKTAGKFKGVGWQIVSFIKQGGQGRCT